MSDQKEILSTQAEKVFFMGELFNLETPPDGNRGYGGLSGKLAKIIQGRTVSVNWDLLENALKHTFTTKGLNPVLAAQVIKLIKNKYEDTRKPSTSTPRDPGL